MDDARILYTNENAELGANYLHIYGIRIVNDCINVCVYSDSRLLEMYLNGRLCSRQKGSGVFDFYEPLEIEGNAQIKIVSAIDPSLYQSVEVTI